MDYDKDKVLEDADAEKTAEPTEEKTETTEKTDEEQTVADTDADTRDLENTLNDIMGRIDDLSHTMNERFDSYAKLLIDTGATVTQTSAPEKPTEEKVECLTDLDYSL